MARIAIMNGITYTTEAEFKAVVEVGLKDAEEGRTISHEELKERHACLRAFGWEPLHGTPTFPSRLKWTRERYYAGVDANVFGEDEKLELIDGEIVIEGMRDRFKTSPQYSWAVHNAANLLRTAFGEHATVGQFAPLSLLEDSDPEPDIAVVDNSWEDNLESHPTTAILVVEIADATLEFDRTIKASLYAAAGVPDYWILNLADRCLEVFRGVVQDANQAFGYRYSQVTVLRGGETVMPLSASNAAVVVSSLLPYLGL